MLSRVTIIIGQSKATGGAMIKIGDLVAVEGHFGDFLGIVKEHLEGTRSEEWTVIEVPTGDYVPCSSEEMTP